MKDKHLDCRGSLPKLNLLPAVVAVAILFLASCTATKQSQYFKTLQQKDTTLTGFIPNDYESKIVKGDRLSVIVSSLNSSEDALFNGTISAAAGSTPAGGAVGGYLVQPDGTIFLHRLGNVKAEGMTRRELAKFVEDKMKAYTKDPIAQVNYLNHKITILGEVGKPQILNLPEEQISLIEALVSSGDINPNAKKATVTIIREEGTQKKVKHVNLEDNSIFSSEWYYVKPNDIILVGADTEKLAKAEKRQNIQSNLSLVISAVSFLLIILDRVIK